MGTYREREKRKRRLEPASDTPEESAAMHPGLCDNCYDELNEPTEPEPVEPYANVSNRFNDESTRGLQAKARR